MYRHLLLLLTILPFFTFGQDTSWQSFKLVNGQIHVPVTVNDVDGFAVIDTGATTTGISNRLIEQHSEKYTFSKSVTISGVMGKRKVRPVHNINISTLNKSIIYRRILPIPTHGKEKHNVIALIGMDFLSHFVVSIDYPNSRIKLSQRSSFVFDKPSNVKVFQRKHFAMVDIELILENNIPLKMLLDTGNNGGALVRRSTLENKNLLRGREFTLKKRAGIYRKVELESYIFNHVVLGPHKINNVVLQTVQKGQKSNYDRSYSHSKLKYRKDGVQGIIGYEILKDFVLTIDTKRKYLRLDKIET